MGAHDRLNRLVFAAYGWPEDITDEGILKNLLRSTWREAPEAKTTAGPRDAILLP